MQMTTADIAVALGVPMHRITQWIRAGKLRGVFISGWHGYWTVDSFELIRFLHGYGGLLNHLHPNEAWRQHVEDGRRSARRRYTTKAEIACALTIAEGHILYLQRRHAFPRPCLFLTGGYGLTGSYYERKEVYDWAVEHAAQYDPDGKARRKLMYQLQEDERAIPHP